jgi:16S rRNA (guanine966-N2)-methyltransferase
MRITGGTARGRILAVPRTGDVRPTADRTRQAIFSSLGALVVGADVLDLFAGTGALGLEAASRGARSVTFVEHHRAAQEAIRQNIAALHFPAGALVCGEVAAVLPRLAGRRFTIIFADPPYGRAAQELLQHPDLPGLLAAGGVLVVESAKRDALTVPLPWALVREAVYGDTRVSRFVVRGATR